MPSSVVGGAARRKAALNWSPWVRSLTHVPLAWTNSPALIEAAAPSTVTRSRWPRTLTRNTQKPLSGLWNVTRSTRPAKCSAVFRARVVAFGMSRSAARASVSPPATSWCPIPRWTANPAADGVQRGHLVNQITEEHFAVLRRQMVEVIAIYAELASEELGKAALDQRVMAAMERVPRHRFVPEWLAAAAYHDMPLPIGFDKTISQPFIVAVMTDLLGPAARGDGARDRHRARLPDGRVGPAGAPGLERRDRRGVRARGRGPTAAARLRQRRHPRRRRLARLGRARPVRQDPGDRGGRA